MSAALPGDPNQYVTRHRRQSSQSQSALADLENRSQPYSPSRSATYLPSTTYHPNSQPRSRTSSVSNNLSRIDTSVALSPTYPRVANQSPSTNPDDFYRQLPTEFDPSDAHVSGLHQEALRTITTREDPKSRVGSNGSYSTNWSADDTRDQALPPNIPGLKARKASVKNLVAQINASSSTELPPVPGPLHSLPNIPPLGNASSFLSSAHISQFGNNTRIYSTPTLYSTGKSSDSMHSDSARDTSVSKDQQRRPLFGEILTPSTTTPSAGYGIVNARRRTGSEGSPLHSPKSMFPPEQSDDQFILSPAVYTSGNQRVDHRRANSERPSHSHGSDKNGVSSPSGHLTSPVSERRPPVTSRIPVRTRRPSGASDSGSSAPASRATSALEKQQPKPETKLAATKSSNAKQSLSVERPSPGRITSPGRSVQSGAKSPSLRANIIAPPPKISPPLRSSRPRMPVSNATTAASRARMAEKFNTMQKMNNEKRATYRRPAKPLELIDIDFVERRSRITRALTKSKENKELKAGFAPGKRRESAAGRTSSQSNATPATGGTSNHIHVDGDGLSQQSQQALYDNSFEDSVEDRQNATRNVLHIVQNSVSPSAGDDVDSPTLGQRTRSFEPSSMRLQTNLLTPRDNAEPQSALTDMTVDTEATHIDPEPQDDPVETAPSLLSHVVQMRERSPSTSYEAHRSTVDFSDRADVESVNLILRNTAYLDDDEAIRKGYRPNFAAHNPLLEEEEEAHRSHRDSWTSSVPEETDQGVDDRASMTEQSANGQEEMREQDERSIASTHHDAQNESYRNTRASDAYTIINIVLQQYSSSGIVDQQFADDVYQKVLETCPEGEDEGVYDSERIEQLCLQEIVRRDEAEGYNTAQDQREDDKYVDRPKSASRDENIGGQNNTVMEEMKVTPDHNLLTLPSTAFGGHRHKSSLDSAEDWASTSPSIGWMPFAPDQATPPNEANQKEPRSPHERTAEMKETEVSHESYKNAAVSSKDSSTIKYDFDEDSLGPEEYGTAIIRAPSRSPPPPPKDDVPSIQKVTRTYTEDSLDTSRQKLLPPHRVASLGKTSIRSQSISRPPSARSRAEVTPWETHDQPEEVVVSAEVRRLNKRKHVIKELVDTEFTYQRDMRVLCDIYKQTATAALSEDDIRVLFGNVEQVQQFARDFLTALKQTSKPSYPAERNERKKDGVENLMHTNSSSSTLASTKIEAESSDLQKDRETRIGDAFEGSLGDMESVYTEYIRNRHAANQRLEILQKSTAAQEWLKECRDNSSDITNAWNLDALLVKPVQRITKYPLLLKELIDATAEDHPDLPTLRRVLNSVTDINMRINEVKKHAEMLDQVLNRKRGQSDVRTGFSKAFGRRAEKLRQHVGITDMYEDTEYDRLRIAYDNNYVQLLVVANDCQIYEKGITQWVSKMVEIAAAAEGWVDVGHSHHQQEESKLRHLAMIIRNVHNIALPDHLEHLQKKVIQPMTRTVETLQKFKDEPKGLLQKRDKRLVDYAQMKNKKDRGERVDKKMSERMDQWEALNTEAKERMKKLLRATAHLVQCCQGHLVQLQMSWMAMIQQKFSNVMGINLNRLSPEEIEKDWQVDFDFQEASALTLGICNGSLMLQAANMTSFLTPGSTLVGDDSPRQMSVSSTNKRSVSLNSEASNVAASLDFSSRPSGTYTQGLPENHFDRPYPYPNGRTRAASTTSGKSLRNPDGSARSSTTAKHTSASANFARPGPSPSIPQDAFTPPHLGIETHSPLMNSFTSQTGNERPVSSSTFFSATAGPSQAPMPHRSRGSGVFTSALPMSDSPVQERHTVETPLSEPKVLFTAASLYEFNIDRALREAGFPYLTYVTGEIFDVLGERGELWLAKNQDDPHDQVGWIWNKHFAKLAE